MEALAAQDIEELPCKKLAIPFNDATVPLLRGEKFGEAKQGPLRAVAVKLGGELRKTPRFSLNLGTHAHTVRLRDPAQVMAAKVHQDRFQGARGGAVQREAGDKLVTQVTDHRAEQRRFAAELLIDGAQRDMRLAGDRLQAQAAVAVYSKQLYGLLQKPVAAGRFIAFAGASGSGARHVMQMPSTRNEMICYHFVQTFGNRRRLEARIMAALFHATAFRSTARWLVNALRQRKILALAFPLVPFLLSGCSPSENRQAAAMPPPLVKIAQPLHREVMVWDEFPGRIAAVESVDVRARVDGYLEKVNFKPGERVKKGDLLFLIDPRPFRALLNHAQAELDQAKARLALAKNNLARADHMYKSRAISEEEYDARSKGLTEATAAVQSAEANVYTARLNLEFTEVRASISGHVGRELITAGNLVKGGGADATQLTFIVSTDPVYVYVDVDERSALKYQRLARERCVRPQADARQGCMPAEMALVDESGFPHRGYIEYESPRLTASTGTLTLRAVFPNPDGLLSPGLFAKLRVPGSAPFQAVLLPDRAVATDLAQKFVWVLGGDNKVERRPVVPGALIDGLQVITEGLGPEDWVVVEGIQKLKPGLAVNAQKPTRPEGGDR